MQSINTYSDNSNLRVLLQGPPGSGKTTTACQFPAAYIADCDLNLAGALRYLRSANLPLPIGYDIIDRDDDGKEVDPSFRFERLLRKLQIACADTTVQTIVVDSATKLSDYIMAHILRQQGKKQMEMQSWGFYFTCWKEFVARITAQKKHFVLICHERVEKDEIDQALKYFLNIPGQFAHIAGSLFTDVWRCEVASKGFGAATTHEFQIRTMPDHKFNLKNSLGLPAVFKFDWKIVESKLS
jgi:nucleoside-triphosphatase THEP1